MDRPEDVPPGQSWPAAIVDGIRNGKVFVLVFSDVSNQSKQVTNEVGEAFDNSIPIVPFRIEEVTPSRELGYYIKSIHWLDAMTPPMERHLDKLAESVTALLSIEKKDQLPAAETVYKAQDKKRKSLPLGAIALIGLAVIVILGIVGLWVVPKLNLESSSPTSTTIAFVADPTELPTPEPISSTEVSSEPGWSDWRPLSFIIPNDRIWSDKEENTYTAFSGNPGESIAWTDEIFDGDLILSLDIGKTGDRASGSIIVYGDGVGFSEGSLIFTLDDGIFWVEKHSIYHQGENFLAVYESDMDFKNLVFSVTIEITGDIANYIIDGEKVASFFIPSEINRSGRIGIIQQWEVQDDRTYSNIMIKTVSIGD